MLSLHGTVKGATLGWVGLGFVTYLVQLRLIARTALPVLGPPSQARASGQGNGPSPSYSVHSPPTTIHLERTYIHKSQRWRRALGGVEKEKEKEKKWKGSGWSGRSCEN